MINFSYPAKLHPLVSQKARYKVAKGGRGSAKSWTIARHLLIEAAFSKQRVLCTREMQNSIRDSVHRLLSDQIWELGLKPYYEIQKDGLYSTAGSEFLFKGLHHHINEIKSTEGITRCWVEEAAAVGQLSWDILKPTIRRENSEIWVSYNPEEEGSATDKLFGNQATAAPDTLVVDINYVDNPFFPEVLRREMEYDKLVDFEKYMHVWMGAYKKYAHALIFKGKYRKEAFDTPDGVQFYFGLDFGFSNDPFAFIRMFIRDKKLYIDWEVYGIGIEIDEMHRLMHTVPKAHDWVITADSQRPDTISHLKKPFRHRDGTNYPAFNVVGAEKGKGSVEDGIQFLRSFEEIVIHERCPGTYGDFNNYKWKQDKVTKDILAIPVDSSNHSPDAARYGLEKYIKSNLSIYDVMRRVG